MLPPIMEVLGAVALCAATSSPAIACAPSGWGVSNPTSCVGFRSGDVEGVFVVDNNCVDELSIESSESDDDSFVATTIAAGGSFQLAIAAPPEDGAVASYVYTLGGSQGEFLFEYDYNPCPSEQGDCGFAGAADTRSLAGPLLLAGFALLRAMRVRRADQ